MPKPRIYMTSLKLADTLIKMSMLQIVQGNFIQNLLEGLICVGIALSVHVCVYVGVCERGRGVDERG